MKLTGFCRKAPSRSFFKAPRVVHSSPGLLVGPRFESVFLQRRVRELSVPEDHAIGLARTFSGDSPLGRVLPMPIRQSSPTKGWAHLRETQEFDLSRIEG
jgi:hypothetical protein